VHVESFVGCIVGKMAQDVGIVETLLTLCTQSTCADGISKRTRVKVNKDGTQTLAASSKVSLKEYTYTKTSRKDSWSVSTYCTRDSIYIGSNIGIGSWSMST